MTHPTDNSRHAGFSLIELLITMAVIGVMSALIIAAITNASRDSSNVVARQQQVVLQQALNAWISASTSTNTVSSARTRYAAASDKLALVRDYLQASTYDHFLQNTTNNSRIQSDALKKANVYLRFSEWNAMNYPAVEMFE